MPAREVVTCSRALVMIGDKPIATLTGTGASQVACSTLYPAVVEDLLSRYRWRFASKVVRLELLAEESFARFRYKYQLPADVCEAEVYAVLVGDSPIKFDRFERHIYCDAGVSDIVYAEVKVIPNAAYWPNYFNKLVELELGAMLAITLTEETGKATFLEGKSLRQYGLAKTLDAQTRTAPKLPVGGLRRYHGGQP